MHDPDWQGDPTDPSGGRPPAGSGPGGGEREPPDEELVRRVAAGDGEALQLLMRRYDRLVRYAVYRTAPERCTRDPDWLDARASETWSGFVRSMQRPGATPPNTLPTYFLQIARNKCLDALRIHRTLSERSVSQDDADVSQLPSAQEDTSEALERLEELENLRSCIAQLDAEDRVLCGQYELIIERRWSEAAKRLGMPESTLRSRWSAVLGRLRSCLEKKKKKNLAPREVGPDS